MPDHPDPPRPDAEDRDASESVPEADALEQAVPVVEDGTGEEADPFPDHLPEDAPEADALEQATPVPVDADDERSPG